jgi:hypothetical protein
LPTGKRPCVGRGPKMSANTLNNEQWAEAEED